MNVYKLTTISSILVSLLIFNIVSYADVEGIIDAQADLLKTESEKIRDKKRASEKSKNGIEAGRQEFIRSCAICHGDEGKGNGPYSAKSYKKPKDLTMVKNNNYGVFPFKKLYEIIDGRDNASTHGSARDMPIWGDRYTAESWIEISTKYSETLARGKILELLLYLESIQDS